MKKIQIGLTFVALLALVLFLAWALAGSTHATQTAASAAKQSSLAVTVLTILLAVVLIGAAIGFLVLNWRYRRLSDQLERQAQRTERQETGRWVAGPNAQWGRRVPENGMQQSIQQLISLQLLQQLQQLGGGSQQNARATLPATEESLPANFFDFDDEGCWYD